MQRPERNESPSTPAHRCAAAARRLARGARLGAAGLGLFGCVEVLDIPTSPELVPTGPWRCLEEPGPRERPEAETAVVQVRACDFVSNNCTTPVTGLSARVCNHRDVGCAEPVVRDIVDDMGLLSFEVPTPVEGFNGYLEVSTATELCTSDQFEPPGALCALLPECDPEAPDERCRVPIYARAMLFFNPPIFEHTAAPLPLPLLPSAAIPRLVAAAGAEGSLDPSTGNLFITAVDCDGTPAPGVTYQIDRHQSVVAPMYVSDGLPSDSAFETDGSGIGGFLGVPAGFVSVAGYNQDLTSIGAVGVHVAPLTMTYSVLAP